MAQKRRGRRRPSAHNFLVFPDEDAIALGALGDQTVVRQANPITLTQAAFIKSVDISMGIHTATPGEGPVLVGISKAELSTSEIAEALVAAPTSQDDVPAIEQSKRFVRQIGQFDMVTQDGVLNDGEVMRIKLNIKVPNGKAMPTFWAKNLSGATLTTGATIRTKAKFYGRWQ